MIVANYRITDTSGGGKANLGALWMGQKKRTNSAIVRFRPSFLTRSSSVRLVSRSERGNLVSLIRDSELLAPFSAAAGKDITTGFGFHTGTESVLIGALTARGLISSFRHGRLCVRFCFLLSCVIRRFEKPKT